MIITCYAWFVQQRQTNWTRPVGWPSHPLQNEHLSPLKEGASPCGDLRSKNNNRRLVRVPRESRGSKEHGGILPPGPDKVRGTGERRERGENGVHELQRFEENTWLQVVTKHWSKRTPSESPPLLVELSAGPLIGVPTSVKPSLCPSALKAAPLSWAPSTPRDSSPFPGSWTRPRHPSWCDRGPLC